MTKVTFFRNNGVLYGFEEEGHSGYADAGEDILCSALSAMTMLIVNTVETSYAADVEYVVSAEETKITVRSRAALPEYESDESRRFAVSGLFSGYYKQLKELEKEYPRNLRVCETELPCK